MYIYDKQSTWINPSRLILLFITISFEHKLSSDNQVSSDISARYTFECDEKPCKQ